MCAHADIMNCVDDHVTKKTNILTHTYVCKAIHFCKNFVNIMIIHDLLL